MDAVLSCFVLATFFDAGFHPSSRCLIVRPFEADADIIVAVLFFCFVTARHQSGCGREDEQRKDSSAKNLSQQLPACQSIPATWPRSVARVQLQASPPATLLKY